MVPYKNHTTLDNSYSCAEDIDVFSWSEGLTLIDILNRVGELKTTMDTCRQLGGSLLWACRTGIQLYGYLGRFTDIECIPFSFFGFFCLILSAELLWSMR
jgi:hypothetical protein